MKLDIDKLDIRVHFVAADGTTVYNEDDNISNEDVKFMNVFKIAIKAYITIFEQLPPIGIELHADGEYDEQKIINITFSPFELLLWVQFEMNLNTAR